MNYCDALTLSALGGLINAGLVAFLALKNIQHVRRIRDLERTMSHPAWGKREQEPKRKMESA